MPIELRVHRAFIIFQDEKVGEIMYELVGECQLPEPIVSKLEKKCISEETISYDLSIPYKNPLLEKCSSLLNDRFLDQSKKSGMSVKAKSLNTRTNELEVNYGSNYYTGLNTI